MNCPNCGKELRENDLFCRHCGARTEKQPIAAHEYASKSSSASGKNKAIIAVLCLIILLLCGLLFFITHNKNNAAKEGSEPIVIGSNEMEVVTEEEEIASAEQTEEEEDKAEETSTAKDEEEKAETATADNDKEEKEDTGDKESKDDVEEANEKTDTETKEPEVITESDTCMNGLVTVSITDYDEKHNTIVVKIENNTDMDIKPFGMPVQVINEKTVALDVYKNMNSGTSYIAPGSYMDITYFVDSSFFDGGTLRGELHIMSPLMTDNDYEVYFERKS